MSDNNLSLIDIIDDNIYERLQTLFAYYDNNTEQNFQQILQVRYERLQNLINSKYTDNESHQILQLYNDDKYLIYEIITDAILHANLSINHYENICCILLYEVSYLKDNNLIEKIIQKLNIKREIINKLYTKHFPPSEEIFEWIWNYPDLLPDNFTNLLISANELDYSIVNIKKILSMYEPNNDNELNKVIDTLIDGENIEILKYILKQWQITITHKHMITAIRTGNLDIVKILIEYGYDPCDMKIFDIIDDPNDLQFANKLAEYGFNPFIALIL